MFGCLGVWPMKTSDPPGTCSLSLSLSIPLSLSLCLSFSLSLLVSNLILFRLYILYLLFSLCLSNFTLFTKQYQVLFIYLIFSAASASQEYILESYVMEFNKNPTTLVQATLRQFPNKGVVLSCLKIFSVTIV
jgi:hypothetical protein